MQKDVTHFGGMRPAQVQPTEPGQSNESDDANEPHYANFSIKQRNKIRKLVKEKLRPRAPDLVFEVKDEWVYYLKDNPEQKVNLNLEIAELLKLALDWKTNDTYDEIEFDLINMRWRCDICFKAKMQNAKKWSQIKKGITGDMKRHLGLKKAGKKASGTNHDAAKVKLGMTKETKQGQKEFKTGVDNAKKKVINKKMEL